VIDFSDNEIKRLDNFPKMNRLTSIIINNNYLARIGKVAENVKNLKCLVLTNNKINNLSEIDNISLFQKLEHLSLIDNPIKLIVNYRLYVIHKIPTLKTLDYIKITKKEKDNCTAFFKSELGKLLIKQIAQEKIAQLENADVKVHTCICICLYVYLCIQMHIFICIRIRLYVNIHIYMYIPQLENSDVKVYMCIYLYDYMYIYVYKCIYLYVYVYVYMYAYIYIYMYICMYTYSSIGKC
jgi:hypothetical protein